jgi:hypothetical protein
VTDPNFGRLLLERYGVPRERFVGNMLVLARDAQGRPTATLGPYWTMLVFVTARRPRPCFFLAGARAKNLPFFS